MKKLDIFTWNTDIIDLLFDYVGLFEFRYKKFNGLLL